MLGRPAASHAAGGRRSVVSAHAAGTAEVGDSPSGAGGFIPIPKKTPLNSQPDGPKGKHSVWGGSETCRYS